MRETFPLTSDEISKPGKHFLLHLMRSAQPGKPGQKLWETGCVGKISQNYCEYWEIWPQSLSRGSYPLPLTQGDPSAHTQGVGRGVEGWAGGKGRVELSSFPPRFRMEEDDAAVSPLLTATM
jgi:hypothetical protein